MTGRVAAALIGVAIVWGLGNGPVMAQGQVCFELWVERNSVYKRNGYCFKTSRAIAYFGNAGCQYDREADVPLSAAERRAVARIRAEERALGCR